MQWLWIGIAFIVMLILNTLFVLIGKPLFYLNDNQILYSFSTIAQVTSGLFALTLAAYAFIDPKLREISAKDSKSSDYAETLRKRYFHDFIALCIICAITIFLSIFCINTYDQLTAKLTFFLIDQTALCFILSVISILLFGCVLLKPSSFSELGKEEKRKIEGNYTHNTNESQFKPFVLYYNKLENLISDFALELMANDLNSTHLKNGKLQIFQALDILMVKEIIDRNIKSKIDELRRYRNAIVHSENDEKVNPVLFDELKQIYQKLEYVYSNRSNQKLKASGIEELYNYGRHIIVNDIDENIMNALSQNKNISLNELSNMLGISQATLIRHLKTLQRDGSIYKNSENRWILK